MKEPQAGLDQREDGPHQIIVESIGSAGASMVRALGTLLPQTDVQLARALMQAPSVLLDDLPAEAADQASTVLQQAGLQTRVAPQSEKVVPGGDAYEVALYVTDLNQMDKVFAEVAAFLGVKGSQAQAMLCASPTILIGKVSQATVESCSKRFSALGVEVDVTHSATALYDVFLGACSPADRARVQAVLREFGMGLDDDAAEVVVQMGLSREQAEALWARFARSSLPLRVVSRDFERFDISLETAPDTPDMIAHLQASTGMPIKVAKRVIENCPVILHQGLTFAAMSDTIEALVELGASATGHLTLFQTFALAVRAPGPDEDIAARKIAQLTDMSETQSLAALRQGQIPGPLTHFQARWVQHELAELGIRADRVLL